LACNLASLNDRDTGKHEAEEEGKDEEIFYQIIR